MRPWLFLNTTLICISIIIPAIAQDQTGCSAANSQILDDCRSASISTRRPLSDTSSADTPQLNLARDIPWDASSENAEWGRTLSFSEQEAPTEPIWMDPDRDKVITAVLYLPPSAKSPIVRTTYSDESMKERSPIVDELRLWTRARKQNDTLEILDITEQVRNPVVVPPDKSAPKFTRVPTPPLETGGTGFSLEKETEATTESNSNSKSGSDCIERTDPDGSYSKKCSQSWSWQSSN